MRFSGSRADAVKHPSPLRGRRTRDASSRRPRLADRPIRRLARPAVCCGRLRQFDGSRLRHHDHHRAADGDDAIDERQDRWRGLERHHHERNGHAGHLHHGWIRCAGHGERHQLHCAGDGRHVQHRAQLDRGGDVDVSVRQLGGLQPTLGQGQRQRHDHERDRDPHRRNVHLHAGSGPRPRPSRDDEIDHGRGIQHHALRRKGSADNIPTPRHLGLRLPVTSQLEEPLGCSLLVRVRVREAVHCTLVPDDRVEPAADCIVEPGPPERVGSAFFQLRLDPGNGRIDERPYRRVELPQIFVVAQGGRPITRALASDRSLDHLADGGSFRSSWWW